MPQSLGLRLAQTGPLTLLEVRSFSTWFFTVHPLGQYRREMGVDGFLEQTEVVSDIRSNPLLLGVLCGLFASGRSVPANRTELYRDCARMLFEQWDQLKGTYITLIDHDVAEAAIRELSHDLLSSGRESMAIEELEEFLVSIYQRELICTRLEARERAVRTIDSWRGRRWILVFDGRRDQTDWYRFAHRTFLEFFAAEHLAFVVDDGDELFRRLRPFIRARSPLPFVHLSLQLTSRRRARDGDDLVSSLLDAIQSDSETLSSPIACATTLFEVLPHMRTSDTSVKTEAIVLVLRWMAALLPRTLDVRRFFAIPYAYCDFRAMSAAESKVADSRFQEELAADEWELNELEVDYLALSRVVLGLDHGSVEAHPIVDCISVALQQVEAGMERQTWFRLALFLEKVPHVESAAGFSAKWRSEVASVAEQCMMDIEEVNGRDPAKFVATLDIEDRWVLIQFLQRPGMHNAQLLSLLRAEEFLVGGTPYPISVGAINYPTVAHVVIAQMSVEQTVDAASALMMLPLSDDWAELSDLFTPWRGAAPGRISGLSVPEVFKCAALLWRLASLGDQAFVDAVMHSLNETVRGHSLLLEVMRVVGSDYEEQWSAVLEHKDLAALPRNELLSVLRLVTSNPGLALASAGAAEGDWAEVDGD